MARKRTSPIAGRLLAMVEESPELKNVVDIYGAILPLIRDAEVMPGPLSITLDQAHAKLQMGLPLLHGIDLELDAHSVYELILRLVRAVESSSKNHRARNIRLPWLRASQEPNTAAHLLRLALEENRLDISALLPHVASGDRGAVTAVAKDLDLDPALVWTLLQNAIKPALRACCRQLTPLAAGIPWHKGYCFVCGFVATLGELQENNQTKHLRCGQCGADWRFRRLQCVQCGNEDHHTLSYFSSEKKPENKEETMRVEVCEKCRGYLKVIVSFSPTPPEMLFVEDLATLQLDYIARQRGYASMALRSYSPGN